jgi:hypothetical protein
MEERDLMKDLRDLPRNSAGTGILQLKSQPDAVTVRKINELVKRVRLARVHAYIIAYLKEQMPVIMGKDRKQQVLVEHVTIFVTEWLLAGVAQ